MLFNNRQATQRSQRGFTLIEVLVVLVIIALMVSVVVLTGGSGLNETAKEEAKRLATILRIAQDEALINSVEVGLILEETEYVFMVYEEGIWVPIADDKIYEQHKIADGLEIAVAVDGFSGINLGGGDEEEEEEDDRKILTPQIYLLSSGEVSPFVINIGTEIEPAFFYRIEGYFDGRVLVDGPIVGDFRTDLEGELGSNE